MIAEGAAALINFLITSPPSFISLVKEREEEVQVEAFHLPALIRSFPAEGPGFGAPWSSCASLHLQPQRSRKKTQLPSQDSCWRRNQTTDPMEPSVLCSRPGSPVSPSLLAPDTPCMVRRDRSFGNDVLCIQQLWGARLSCQRSGWPGHCHLTAGLTDLKDLFQPEQFCDSRTLWSKGFGGGVCPLLCAGCCGKAKPVCASVSPLSLPWWPASAQGRAGSGAASGMGSTAPGAQHSPVPEPLPPPRSFDSVTPDTPRKGSRPRSESLGFLGRDPVCLSLSLPLPAAIPVPSAPTLPSHSGGIWSCSSLAGVPPTPGPALQLLLVVILRLCFQRGPAQH